MCWTSSRLWPSVIVQQDNTGTKHSASLVQQNLYHRPHFTVGGSWNKSRHLEPQQICYSENSGSTVNACVIRGHYSITYTQSLHSINGLLGVVRVENLLFGRLSYFFLPSLRRRMTQNEWEYEMIWSVGEGIEKWEVVGGMKMGKRGNPEENRKNFYIALHNCILDTQSLVTRDTSRDGRAI